MGVLFFLFLSLCFAADPPIKSTHFDELNIIEAQDPNHLHALYVQELSSLEEVLKRELVLFQQTGFVEVFKLNRDEGKRAVYQSLRILSTLLYLTHHVIRYMKVLFESESLKSSRSYLITVVDRSIEAFISNHPFFPRLHFRSDDGDYSVVHLKHLMSMPVRYSDTRSWIRIVFKLLSREGYAFISGSASTMSKTNGMKERVTPSEETNLVQSRALFSEDVVCRFMKLQYLAFAMLPKAPMPRKLNSHYSAISQLSVSMFLVQQDISKYTAEQAMSMACDFWQNGLLQQNIWALFEYEAKEMPGIPPAPLAKEKDWLMLISQFAKNYLKFYPEMASFFEKHLGIADAQEKLVAEEEKQTKKAPRAKGKNRKGGKKQKVTNNKSVTEVAAKKAPAKDETLVYDSDGEPIDHRPVAYEESLSTTLSDLSLQDWNHSRLWFNAALLKVSEHCIQKVLIPERKQRHGAHVPEGFTWKSWVSEKDAKLAFCAKAASLRNQVVHSDEILKLLPDADEIYTTLSKNHVANLDRGAISFLLSLAPSQRYKNDNNGSESTLLKNSEAKYPVITLGMHRLCLRFRSSGLGISTILKMCDSIAQVRNSLAHPQGLNDSNIELLSSEIKPWVETRFLN